MSEVQSRVQAESAFPALDIATVLSMLAVFALTVGYTYPAIAFNLEARGLSASMIGAQAAFAGLGILVGSLAVPPLAARVGTWPLAVAGFGGTALSMASFGFSEALALWFVLRFLLGISVAILFIISETWINMVTPDAMRGRVIALYTASIAGFFALGPLLIPVIGYSGPGSFGLMGLVVAVTGLSLIRLRRLAGPLEAAPLRLTVRVVAAIPVLLAAVAAFGYLDGATLSLWVVYALWRGLEETGAAMTLTALIIGNVALQLPIGWLADRMSRRLLLALLSTGGFLGAALMPWIDLSSWWGIAWIVVWGALSFGVYTLALTIIGQHLTGIGLVAATSGFGIAWGVGALAGAWITGALMDVIGPWALPAGIAAIYAALTLAALALPPIRQSLRQMPGQ